MITVPTSSDRWLTYEDVDNGIKIDYPANWKINTEGIKQLLPKQFDSLQSSILFQSPYNESSFILMEITQSNTFNNINDSMFSIAEGIKQRLPGFQVEDFSNIILDGQPATKTIFSAKTGETNVRGLQILVNDIDKIYVLQYTSKKDPTWYSTPISLFSYHLPIAEKMINSFKIINNDIK